MILCSKCDGIEFCTEFPRNGGYSAWILYYFCNLFPRCHGYYCRCKHLWGSEGNEETRVVWRASLSLMGRSKFINIEWKYWWMLWIGPLCCHSQGNAIGHCDYYRLIHNFCSFGWSGMRSGCDWPRFWREFNRLLLRWECDWCHSPKLGLYVKL